VKQGRGACGLVSLAKAVFDGSFHTVWMCSSKSWLPMIVAVIGSCHCHIEVFPGLMVCRKEPEAR
jgi:hypothetical protein